MNQRRLLGEPLLFDWKIVAATVAATLLLMIDAYNRLTAYKWLDRAILYLVIPLLIVLIAFRDRPGDYGFTLGDWQTGLVLVGISVVLGAPIIWFVGRTAAMTSYYAGQAGGLPWNTFLDLLGWEYFFRGFILFTYARKMGPNALWLQAMPFALAHVGKPEVEALSTIFGGFVFGWVAYRSRSFLYPFLIHWFVASFTILVASRMLG